MQVYWSYWYLLWIQFLMNWVECGYEDARHLLILGLSALGYILVGKVIRNFYYISVWLFYTFKFYIVMWMFWCVFRDLLKKSVMVLLIVEVVTIVLLCYLSVLILEESILLWMWQPERGQSSFSARRARKDFDKKTGYRLCWSMLKAWPDKCTDQQSI